MGLLVGQTTPRSAPLGRSIAQLCVGCVEAYRWRARGVCGMCSAAGTGTLAHTCAERLAGSQRQLCCGVPLVSWFVDLLHQLRLIGAVCPYT
eukprot:gene8709-1095_t